MGTLTISAVLPQWGVWASTHVDPGTPHKVRSMHASVLTQHNNNGRTGVNPHETRLRPEHVDVNRFGKLFTQSVVGQVYAQPLYVPFVAIPGKGVHHVVYVATMDNWVYAFDADDALGPNAEPLWSVQLDPNPVPAQIFSQNHYADIIGKIGILSTPVIDAEIGTSAYDPSRGTMYLVLATMDPALFPTCTQDAFRHLLYAIDIGDGQLRDMGAAGSNPVEIRGTVPGVGYAKALASDLPIDLCDGGAKLTIAIGFTGVPSTDPLARRAVTVTDSQAGEVCFVSMQHIQRPGLLLHRGDVVICFGAHGDFDPYHGWAFAYDARTLQRKSVFCATPNGGRSGIWQAGEALVADAHGNVYIGTGNGDFKQTQGVQPDLGESYFRLKLHHGGLTLTGWVNLISAASDPLEDEDLGAASPTLLPDGRLVGGGKDGNFYLLDPELLDNEGNPGAITQTFLASRGPGSRDTKSFHIHGSPVVYEGDDGGVLVYVWGENDLVRAYAYDPVSHSFPGQPNQKGVSGTPIARGTIFASNDVISRDGMPGGMLSISAHGRRPGTAILWTSIPPFQNANQQTVAGELLAYDATRFDEQGRLVLLWHSHQFPTRDDVGSFAKFCCPTIANGKVYHPTFDGVLNVYGLLAEAEIDGGYNFAFTGRAGLTLNGIARSNGGPIRLAGQHGFQAGSAFSTHRVNVRQFDATFEFQINHAVADGMTFTIQGEGRHALGGPGNGLGYGPNAIDPLDPGLKILRSIAIKFDLFSDRAVLISSTGIYRDGEMPSDAGAIDLEPAGIDLHSGHIFRATLHYDGVNLSVTIEDEQTQVVACQSYLVDIPAITGPETHVGFTAATGGLMAEFDILSWDFTS